MWKKNSPLLYRQLVTSLLDWPSQSVEWFPEVTTVGCGGGEYRQQNLLYGTTQHGTEEVNNSVVIGRLTTPVIDNAQKRAAIDAIRDGKIVNKGRFNLIIHKNRIRVKFEP